MSNHYEMMYILRPDLSEEKVREAVGKYQNFIAERGADNIQIQNRGKRRLAYPIKKILRWNLYPNELSSGWYSNCTSRLSNASGRRSYPLHESQS